MATRAIYFPIAGYPYCREQTVSFTWSKGSKRQNIRAVHEVLHATDPEVSILEVSSASAQPEGEAVSTLRLQLHLASTGQDAPVSTVFEASKVFEKGGPYTDLLGCTPPQVHKDGRLRGSGPVLRYALEGAEYPREPHPDAFFEWLYCTALMQCPEKAEPLSRYGAFSDIAAAADSRKYYGDTSRAAAIYAGLAMAGKLGCVASFEAFVAEVYTDKENTAASSAPEPEKEEPEQTALSLPESPAAEEPTSAPQPETTPEPEYAPEPAPEQEAETEPGPETEPKPEAPVQPEETAQPDGNNKMVAIPTVEQLAQIAGQPRAISLMISLGKNAGMTAKNAGALGRKAKEYLLGEYRKAQKTGTLQMNKEKNKITFPMELADTGFRAIGQLTRTPVLEQGWKFNYQVLDAAHPPVDTVEYIGRCGYLVTQWVGPDELPPIAVQRLAWKTGEALSDPAAAEFLQGIRSHIQCSGPFSVRFPKGKKSIVAVTELAQAWEKMGLLTSVGFYPPQNITCVLGDSEVVRNFLNGRWLELFVMHQVREVLARFEQEQGAMVSLAANVVLAEPECAEHQNELDVAFLVNGEFFWVEAKSSSKGINYGKYANLCKKLKVKTDRLLLVNSELTDEECEGISYFWNYRVANCATTARQLEEMIRQQLTQDASAAQPAAAEDTAAEPEKTEKTDAEKPAEDARPVDAADPAEE